MCFGEFLLTRRAFKCCYTGLGVCLNEWCAWLSDDTTGDVSGALQGPTAMLRGFTEDSLQGSLRKLPLSFLRLSS